MFWVIRAVIFLLFLPEEHVYLSGLKEVCGRYFYTFIEMAQKETKPSETECLRLACLSTRHSHSTFFVGAIKSFIFLSPDGSRVSNVWTPSTRTTAKHFIYISWLHQQLRGLWQNSVTWLVAARRRSDLCMVLLRFPPWRQRKLCLTPFPDYRA